MAKYQTDDNENEFGLIQNSGDKRIYGNVIVMKTYMPMRNNSMVLKDIHSSDIKEILHSRANTKVILYDNGDYMEKELFGPMDEFANTFFEEEDLYRIENSKSFLKHNINIGLLSLIMAKKEHVVIF